ncbi:hypothetical protein C2845_PM09G15450 [Panicum miliaceum]|uniref:Uncharacterized protein n=1 Tax=Panicum miliaceum TaxID=4540 RepID=A0A3L6S295_PANMI|nr:hypothetical protein C2845_PM09G15450 [Panicum miliaceum]
MTPVRLSRFSHLAFAVVDTPTTAPAQVVRDALVVQGGNPHVTLAPSTFGAMMVMFQSNNARENAVERQPFLGREHTVTLVRHGDDTPNHHCFENKAFVTVAIKDYPLEHWNRERIIFSAGPYAKPHFADPVCVQAIDFSVVILPVKAEGVTDIPFEEYFKNHCGVGALAHLEIIDVELLGDTGSDSDSSSPPSLGPPIPNSVGDGAGLSTRRSRAALSLVLGWARPTRILAPGWGRSANGPAPAHVFLEGPAAPHRGVGPMSLDDILPAPFGRHKGERIIPEGSEKQVKRVDVSACASQYLKDMKNELSPFNKEP